MAVKGGAAQPISEQTTGAVKAGPAIPVYGYTGTPSDRAAGAGPARPVKLLTDADLRQNGGAYVVAGTPAEPMYDAPAGMAVASGPAQPIYLVGGALAGGGQTKFYVDATLGLDTNPGTLAAPWQTLAKVNGYTFPAGAQIFLKKGERWVNQTLIVPADGLSFGAYGTGANPIIDGSLTMTGWALDSGAIYKSACTLADDISRCTFENGVRLVRKTSKAAMTTSGCFYLDDAGDMLYVRASDDSDPTGKTIKITSQARVVNGNLHSYLTFDSIDTMMGYYSGYDFRGVAAASGHDITVSNCTSSWNTQRSFNAAAFGSPRPNHDNLVFINCVAHDSIGEGFWIGFGSNSGCINCISYHNGIDQTKGYASLALAGGAFTIGSSATDCFLRQCTGYDCANETSNVSIEWVPAEGNQPVRTIMDRCFIYRTAYDQAHIQDAGDSSVITNCVVWSTYGVGVGLRAGSASGSVSTNLTVSGCTFWSNVATAQQLVWGYLGSGGTFKNNIYCCAGAAGQVYVIAVGYETTFTSDYNEWTMPTGTVAKWGASWLSFANWKTTTSQDAHSRNDADPKFVDPVTTHNFHLQVTSPCKDVGIAVTELVTDYDGVARADPPDIGAFEYV
jgi:hypothetical protein